MAALIECNSISALYDTNRNYGLSAVFFLIFVALGYFLLLSSITHGTQDEVIEDCKWIIPEHNTLVVALNYVTFRCGNSKKIGSIFFFSYFWI